MYDWKDVTVAKITHVFDPARNAATQANGDGSATTVLSSAGECDLFFKLEKTDNFDAVSDKSVATVDGEGVHRGDEEHESLFEVGPPVPIGKSQDGKVAAQSSLWPAAYPTGGGEDSVEVKSAAASVISETLYADKIDYFFSFPLLISKWSYASG